MALMAEGEGGAGAAAIHSRICSASCGALLLYLKRGGLQGERLYRPNSERGHKCTMSPRVWQDDRTCEYVKKRSQSRAVKRIH